MDFARCQRRSPGLASPRGGRGPARQGGLAGCAPERCWDVPELGRLTLAAVAGAGAHAAGAQATRRDGTAGAAGRAQAGAHCHVPAAGGATDAARHGPGAGHAEVPAHDPAPGAADTCRDKVRVKRSSWWAPLASLICPALLGKTQRAFSSTSEGVQGTLARES